MTMNRDSLGEGQGSGKQSLRRESMDNGFAIKELGDVEVAGGGDELVGVVAAGERGER
jgi:hypothetical protein